MVNENVKLKAVIDAVATVCINAVAEDASAGQTQRATRLAGSGLTLSNSTAARKQTEPAVAGQNHGDARTASLDGIPLPGRNSTSVAFKEKGVHRSSKVPRRESCGAARQPRDRRVAAGLRTRAAVQACAQTCASCADECERHAQMHHHCRVCAEACRQCEDACRNLLAAMS